MADELLLPDYEQIRGSTRYTTDYRVPEAPWRLVLHTVEGDPATKAAMNYTARNHRWGPHLWVSPRLKHKIQTVPLNKSASALLHPSGTIETNHMKAIQVEQFGFANGTQDWSDEWADWIGEFVIAAVYIAVGGALNLDYEEQTFGAGDGIILATSSSPIRHDASTWRRCNWVTTHQRIIYNDHWDCGKFKLRRALAAARETVGNPGPVDPLPPVDTGEMTVSEADRVIQHMDNILLKDMQARTDQIAGQIARAMSWMAENQKTAVLYRVAGTTAPWYGLVGGRVVGPMDVSEAIEFKAHHEITENSIEISEAWHEIYTNALGVVEVSDKSVEDIANAVNEVNAQLLNGLPGGDELVQRIVQRIVVEVGEQNKEILGSVADALKQASEG